MVGMVSIQAPPVTEKTSPRGSRSRHTTSKDTKSGQTIGPAWAPDERAARLVGVLGNKGVAQLLSVSESQPSRWKTGEEVPSARSAPLLVDLDHVVGRLLLIWDQSVVLDWLTGPNGFLEGARPIDVIATRGTNEVVEAVEAEAAGGYA
jgi:hypothetical protein